MLTASSEAKRKTLEPLAQQLPRRFVLAFLVTAALDLASGMGLVLVASQSGPAMQLLATLGDCLPTLSPGTLRRTRHYLQRNPEDQVYDTDTVVRVLHTSAYT